MAALCRYIAAAALLQATIAGPANGTDLIVHHGWSSPAEIAALNVLKGEMEERGHRWIPLAVPHTNAQDMDILGLIEAGSPPHVFLEPSPNIYRTLEQQGRTVSLDQQFTDSGLLDVLPDVVRQSITVDGQIVKIPATIHVDAMIYYNRNVAAAYGVEPEGWTTLDEMWTDLQALSSKGHHPIAIGAEPWQIGYLFHSLVVTLGGAELYSQLYAPVPDPAAFNDTRLLDAFSWLRRFSTLATQEAANQPWNVATNAVISGDALMQIHGDWMKGEWSAAGRTEQDYGCLGLPGALGVPVTVDAWGLLGGTSPEIAEAQHLFAALAVDQTVQAEFARAKGSTPIRMDARGQLDHCSHLVLGALERPGFAVPTPHLIAPPEWIEAVWSVAAEFWADRQMTPEDAINALRIAGAQQAPAP